MPEKKKILYLSTKSVYGGAQRYILDLIDNLPKETYTAEAGAGGHGKFAEELNKRGVPYHEIAGLERDINPFRDIRSFANIYRTIRAVRPDILHLNGSKVSILGAIAGKILGTRKIVSSTHGWAFLEDRSKFERRVLKFATKIGSWFQDTIICVSHLDYIVGERERIANPKKLTQIHNGIAPKQHVFLPRKEAREKLFEREHIKPGNYFIVGTIAEYTKNKGLYYLIEAAHHLVEVRPDALFLLLGWGEEKEFLQSLIERHGLQKNVYLVDAIPEASTYLHAFDMFVLPSVKEGFAYVLLEASLAELPVVATRVGGNPEIITNLENGLLIPPLSPAEIINATFHLLKNPDDRTSFGKRARQKVLENFSLETMISLTARAYES